MPPLNIREERGGIIFQVRVLPRSSKNLIAGVSEGMLKIKLTAPPVEGAGNEMLIKFLSEKLNIPKSKISIVRGQSSRSKTILAEGLSAAALEELTSGR